MVKRIFVIEIDHSAYNKNQFNQILKELEEMAHVEIKEAHPVDGLRMDNPHGHIHGWLEPWKDESKTVLERTRLWVENRKPSIEPWRWYDRVNASKEEFQQALDKLVEEGVMVIEEIEVCAKCGSQMEDDGTCMSCEIEYEERFGGLANELEQETRTKIYYTHKDKI